MGTSGHREQVHVVVVKSGKQSTTIGMELALGSWEVGRECRMAPAISAVFDGSYPIPDNENICSPTFEFDISHGDRGPLLRRR